ncbi:MAG: ROK family protein [Nitrospirae bacterium]|nr:ROK family protein [Nitrospirota bacterium]
MKNAIGIDVGGTNIKIARVSMNGEVIQKDMVNTPSSGLKDALSSMLKGFIDKDVIGVGIGIAGVIDRKAGQAVKSPNIPELTDFPIRETLSKEFSMPVIVENDASVYAWGEKWLGAGRDFENFILLTLGTGIGGGIIYNGGLFTGAAEVGHMVIEPQGLPCSCGSYGCLESYASGRAIVNRAVGELEKNNKSILKECCEGNFYKLTSEDIYKAALDGDSLSREVFRETGRYLGLGIVNLINIFSPEAIILGGGLIGAWDLFIEELKKEVTKRAFLPFSQNIKILPAALKEDAGPIGAAGLVFKTFGSEASHGSQ